MIFELHTEVLGKKTTNFCRCSSLGVYPTHFLLTIAVIHYRKGNYIKMDFYSILIYILHCSPPGKWVPLGQMVEGGSKNSNFFTSIQWRLLLVLLINAVINFDSALPDFFCFSERYGIHSSAPITLCKSLQPSPYTILNNIRS